MHAACCSVPLSLPLSLLRWVYCCAAHAHCVLPILQVRQELSSKVVSASSEDNLSAVKLHQLVGRGTFGRVYKADWKGVTVAMKVGGGWFGS